MRTLTLIVPTVALAIGASPVGAEQASSSTASTNDIIVKGELYEKKVVCKHQQNTGTRFSTRICHTNKVWDEMREQHRRSAREMADRPLIHVEDWQPGAFQTKPRQ